MDRTDEAATVAARPTLDGATAAEAPRIDIDYAEIQRRIPHRYPFLLVDRCEHYRARESVVGIKCVSINEPYFQGHFPQSPVMPGVLICEAMAQTGAVLMSKTLEVDVTGKVIYFMSLDNARFRRAVRPGDVLRMQVNVLRARDPVFKFHGDAFVDGQLAAECDFAAMVSEIAR